MSDQDLPKFVCLYFQTPWFEFVDYAEMEKRITQHQKNWQLHNQFGRSPGKQVQHEGSKQLGTFRWCSQTTVVLPNLSPLSSRVYFLANV